MLIWEQSTTLCSAGGVQMDSHSAGHPLACADFGRGSTDGILCFLLKGSKGDRGADVVLSSGLC